MAHQGHQKNSYLSWCHHLVGAVDSALVPSPGFAADLSGHAILIHTIEAPTPPFALRYMLLAATVYL